MTWGAVSSPRPLAEFLRSPADCLPVARGEAARIRLAPAPSQLGHLEGRLPGHRPLAGKSEPRCPVLSRLAVDAGPLAPGLVEKGPGGVLMPCAAGAEPGRAGASEAGLLRPSRARWRWRLRPLTGWLRFPVFQQGIG